MPLLKQKNSRQEKELLGFFPFFPHLQTIAGIALRHNKKAESFTAILTVLAVMYVMRVDHAVQVSRAIGRPPANALVHN